jgi:predicted Zn-dependent peptidase
MKTSNSNLIISKTSSSLVAVNIYVAVGSRDEPTESNGIAHLAEHLLYQRVVDTDTDIIKKPWLESLDATTYKNRTEFEFEISEANQDEIPKIVSQFLNPSDFHDKSLQKELKVLNEELIEDEEDEHYLLYKKESEWCYSGTSLGMPTGGTTKSISNITLDKLNAFIGQHYTAERVIVSIVGNVDDSMLRSKLSSLADIERIVDLYKLDKVSLVNESKTLYLEKESEQIELSESKFSRPKSFKDVVFFEFFTATLYSYLFRKIRESTNVYEINVRDIIYSDLMELNIFMKFGSDKFDELMSQYQKALLEFPKLSVQALDNAKKLFLLNRIKEEQSMLTKAHYLSWYSALFGVTYYVKDVEATISALEVADLGIFAKQYSLGTAGQRTLVGGIAEVKNTHKA